MSIISEGNPNFEKDLQTGGTMIEIFCHGNHGTSEGLCQDCQKLLDYVRLRLEHCPLLEDKPACSQCPVQCYKPDMKKNIRAVMRYAGPRMLYLHPILAIRHYLRSSQRPA